jgi:hypothetical protein
MKHVHAVGLLGPKSASVSFGGSRTRIAVRDLLTVVLAMMSAERGVFAATSGELELRVTEEDTGKPLPVRVHLRDQRGKPVKPPRFPYWHDHFVMPGKAVLELRPGTYTFEMERGPEYPVRTGKFVLKSGDADHHEVTMKRFVEMKQEGWWSGDLHIHRPPKEIELLMLAEDLHVAPLITWWNDTNAWTKAKPPEPLLVRFDTDRYYHWMAGEDERAGGALLFFNLPQPLLIAGSSREQPSPCDFLKQARGHSGVHVDVEKPFWWDVPVWIATGMVDSIGLCNNHMQRDGMLTNEAWGKPREKSRFPDPHGNGLWSQEIYYRLLECGLRLPPSAGSASGVLANPVGYNRVYVHCGPSLAYDRWWEHLRAGRVVVTNGPLIRDPRVNGQLPGHVFQARAGDVLKLQATLNVSVRDRVDYLEIIKNRQIVQAVRLDQWAKAGGELPPVEFRESGWMLIRAVTDNPKTYRFASTGPFYVEVDSRPRISKQSAQFFLDWVYERARRLDLQDPREREAVLTYHRAARDFWKQRVESANAE